MLFNNKNLKEKGESEALNRSKNSEIYAILKPVLTTHTWQCRGSGDWHPHRTTSDYGCSSRIPLGYGGYKPFSYDSYSADNFPTFAHFPTSINLRPQTRNIPNPTLFQSYKSLNPINPASDNYPRTSTTSPLPCLDLTFFAATINICSGFFGLYLL